MKRLIPFAAAVPLFLIACVQEPSPVAPDTPAVWEAEVDLASMACANCVFGPHTYIRMRGQPRTATEAFSADPEASYILDIDDGGSRGADGRVVLNGEVLLDYRTDDEEGPRHVRRPVDLLASNVLEVRLTGKPGSELTIQLIREGPILPDVFLSDMTLSDPPAVLVYGGSEPVYYTGTVTNNSGGPVGTGYSPDESRAVLQHWVVQGSAMRAAGGESFSPCYAGGAFGVIPEGACSFERAASALGPSSGGTGTIVSGAATLLVELKLQSSSGAEVILDTHSFPISVVVP